MVPAIICQCHCQVLIIRRKAHIQTGRVSTAAMYCQKSIVAISASPTRYSTVRVCKAGGEKEGREQIYEVQDCEGLQGRGRKGRGEALEK